MNEEVLEVKQFYYKNTDHPFNVGCVLRVVMVKLIKSVQHYTSRKILISRSSSLYLILISVLLCVVKALVCYDIKFPKVLS